MRLLCKIICVFSVSIAPALAQEESVFVQYFESAGLPFTLNQLDSDSPPAQLVDGPAGKFLRLTQATRYQISTIVFDSVLVESYEKLTVDFHFRIIPSLRADGFSLILFNADEFIHGDMLPVFYSEEPNIVKSFGMGFDIHRNQGTFYDLDSTGTTFNDDPDHNHISLHLDGEAVGVFSIDPAVFDLANGIFNHFHIELVPVAAGTEVSVTVVADKAPFGVVITPIERFLVENLHPYKTRIAFSARVGSASTFHDLDNVEIRFE